MRYTEALAALYALQTRGIHLGLDRVRSALRMRGSPERGLRIIQVAGTNGKGSVAAMVEASLRAAGFRSGLFTSPHLHRFVERIRIAGRPMSQEETTGRIVELLRFFGAEASPALTFFELTTLMGLEAFRDHACDIAVLEVGLGGRLDATTAAPAMLSVITHIARDHTDLLGHTIASIAREKAAILRPDTPAVIGRCEGAARNVISTRARAIGAPCLWIDRDFSLSPSDKSNQWDARVGDTRVRNLRLALAGAHQADNAACAVAALVRLRELGLTIPDAAIRHGIGKVKWPGRLEHVAGKPSFLFDAAHNPDGCQSLVSYIATHKPKNGRTVLLFGAMGDKDYPAMLTLLGPHFDSVCYARPPMARAASCAELQKAMPGAASRNLSDACARARRAAGPTGLVVVAGSIFLMAEVRAQILGLRSDPLIRM